MPCVTKLPFLLASWVCLRELSPTWACRGNGNIVIILPWTYFLMSMDIYLLATTRDGNTDFNMWLWCSPPPFSYQHAAWADSLSISSTHTRNTWHGKEQGTIKKDKTMLKYKRSHLQSMWKHFSIKGETTHTMVYRGTFLAKPINSLQ